MKTIKTKPTCEGTATKCKTCRHVNQDTDDYNEGLIICGILGTIRSGDSTCDAPVEIDNKLYFMYEKYNGNNCTYNLKCQLRIDLNE